jgi:hypothetical protein
MAAKTSTANTAHLPATRKSPVRQAITFELVQAARHAEIGTPSRFKPAVHHARNRRPVTLEIGT